MPPARPPSAEGPPAPDGSSPTGVGPRPWESSIPGERTETVTDGLPLLGGTTSTPKIPGLDGGSATNRRDSPPG